MFGFPSILEIAYNAPAILLALSFHEFAHALAAHYYGDDTAKNLGRLTVNPLAHLDPFGTIALFLVGFGWAKPVPVNPYNYRGNKRVADSVVSLAGPVTNLILSFIGLLAYTILLKFGFTQDSVTLGLLQPVIVINAVLFIFNLIPVPPLDGSHILFNLLPPGKREISFFLQKYGYVILLILIFTGLTRYVLWPLVNLVINFETSILNLFF